MTRKVSEARAIELAEGAAPVQSVHGRTGAVAGADSDYDTDNIDNASGVVGADLSTALDQLDTDIATNTSDIADRALVTDYMSRQNNTVQNLNGTNVVVNWHQVVKDSGGSITYSGTNPSRFSVADTGTYFVSVNIVGDTPSTQRANITVQLRLNGVTLRGPIGASGYLRYASGADTSHITLSYLYPLTAGDYVEWVCNQEAAAGNCDTLNGGCNFSLWKIA